MMINSIGIVLNKVVESLFEMLPLIQLLIIGFMFINLCYYYLFHLKGIVVVWKLAKHYWQIIAFKLHAVALEAFIKVGLLQQDPNGAEDFLVPDLPVVPRK